MKYKNKKDLSMSQKSKTALLYDSSFPETETLRFNLSIFVFLFRDNIAVYMLRCTKPFPKVTRYSNYVKWYYHGS